MITAGGPQPYMPRQNAAAAALGIALPGSEKLPGLGTDLTDQVAEAEKLKKQKLQSMDPMQSPAAAMLLGGGQ